MIRRYFVNKFNVETNYIKTKKGRDRNFYLERVGYFVECLSQTKHQALKDIFKFGEESLLIEL